MTDETITTPHGQLPVYVAEPTGIGPWPGVIVLHDAGGMSNDTRRQVEWLAGAGYLAAAPDLFAHANTAACLWAIFRDVRAGRGRFFDEIEATRRRLAGQPSCTGRIGIIGFAWAADSLSSWPPVTGSPRPA